MVTENTNPFKNTLVKLQFSATEDEETIRKAIQHWTDNTCATFEEITDDSSPEYSHIIFINGAGYV